MELMHGPQPALELIMIEVPIAAAEDIAMIQRLRTVFPSAKLLVLVGGSQRDAPARLQHFLQAGAHLALPNPIGRAAVLAAVQRLVTER